MFNISLANHKIKQGKRTTPKVSSLTSKPLLSWSSAWFLWFSQCVNVILISTVLSLWMSSILVLTLVWQAVLLNKKVASDKQVSTILLMFFSISACIIIFISAKDLGVLNSMVHLLCFSYVFKAFELKKRSDFYQLWLLGVFVLAAALIFKQNLVFAALSFIVLIINLAVLLQFFSGSTETSKSVINKTLKESLLLMKTVTILVTQSMILAVVLFLVVPRLAPFWQIPLAKSAKTGLSDTVQPGDIANLARSTELAFRADFSGSKIPDYAQLYWRSMTLENYNGRQWTRAAQFRESFTDFSDNVLREQSLNNNDLPVTSYQVIAEPSFTRYLFTLTPATSSDGKLNPLSDYSWQAKKTVNQSINYSMKSYLTAPVELELDAMSSKINLAYPIDSNPKLEALANQLRRDYVDVEARSQVVLDMIAQQQFFYTLQPPLLDENSLDQFFFTTKAGFCVHYASAYTFLMRASGVPARMVTGYLGGEFNNKSKTTRTAGHMSVYQYDAHAWSEIWVKGKGWLRVDPTGSVDPQRVNSGLSMQLLQQQSSLNRDFISLYQFKQFAWLNTLRLQFDALDYQWARLVLGYTAEKQIDLLKQLFGQMMPWKLAMIITCSLLFSFILFILIFKWRDREKNKTIKLTSWLVLYYQALALLAKKGMIKESELTVNAFAKEVRQKYPSIAIHFTRFSHSFNQLNYQQLSVNEQHNLEKKMRGQFHSFAQALKSLK